MKRGLGKKGREGRGGRDRRPGWDGTYMVEMALRDGPAVSRRRIKSPLEPTTHPKERGTYRRRAFPRPSAERKERT